MMICFFPGTFNPIHLAHIKMAQIVLKMYNFDKIIFIPSYIPPHKNINSNVAKHRLNMVKLAVQGNSMFEVSDIEYLSECKSYTLYTVKKLRAQYNIQDRLNMLIGTDAFLNIKSWYKTDELKELVHFIVFPRGEDIINENDYTGYSYELVKTDKIDISSSDIRNNNNNNNKTTKEVGEYIVKYELYK